MQVEGIKSVVFHPATLSGEGTREEAVPRSGGNGVIEYDGADA